MESKIKDYIIILYKFISIIFHNEGNIINGHRINVEYTYSKNTKYLKKKILMIFKNKKCNWARNVRDAYIFCKTNIMKNWTNVLKQIYWKYWKNFS